jgi:hypothetical protein
VCFKIFIVTTRVEIPERFPSAKWSCSTCSLTMLLHHTLLDKNLWTLVHELLHGLSMLLDISFIFPTGIFYWVSLPLDQIFKIGLSLGLFANPLINDLLHLWFFCYRNLFLPLNLLLILCSLCVIFPLRIQV